MSEPTAEELLVVKEFRTKIQDLDLSVEDSTDLQLLRWLRARDLNIANANSMLRKSLEWRKQNENILVWKAPERYEKDYPYEITGFDPVSGHPIVVCPIGSWDCRKAVSLKETETLIFYTVQMFERILNAMKEGSKLVGKEVTQANYIVDFKKFSYMTLTSLSSVLLPVARRFEENFPETLHVGYLINCPPAFQILFTLIKAVMSSRTLSKVHVLSAEKTWKPLVTKAFPLDLIPEEYGGYRKSEMLNDSGNGKPESVANDMENDVGDLTVAKILPGSKLEVEIFVPGPNMDLMWVFCIGNQEIGFSITGKSNSEKVLPYKFYKFDPSNAEAFAGSVKCNSGTYIGLFDNSFGKEMKQVKYSFNVI